MFLCSFLSFFFFFFLFILSFSDLHSLVGVRVWCGCESGVINVYDILSNTSRTLSSSTHRSAILEILEITLDCDDSLRGGTVVCSVDLKGNVVVWHRDSLSELGKHRTSLSRNADEPVVMMVSFYLDFS